MTEEPKIKCQHFQDQRESKGIPEKHKPLFHRLCFIDDAKAFDCVDHNKLWKALKEMGIPDHLTCLLRNLYVGQEAKEPYREQLTGSGLRKEYNRAVCCHPV